MNYPNNAPSLRKIHERNNRGFEKIEMFNSLNEKIMPQTIHAMHDLSPYMKTSKLKLPVKSTLLTVLLSTLAFIFTKSVVRVLSKRVSFIENMSENTSYVVEAVMYAVILCITISLSIGINFMKKNART